MRKMLCLQKYLNLLCLCLIAINLFFIFRAYPKFGWDFNIFCGAVKAFENNEDFYLVENLEKYTNDDLSFNFPPITILFFKLLCYFHHFLSPVDNYHIIWSLCLIGSFLIIAIGSKNSEPLLLITLLITGFMATYWNFFTGNIGLIELFIFSITFYWILKKNYYLASFFLVLLSIFKILPLIFCILFIFSEVSKSAKLKIFSLITGLFIGIHILSYILFPNVTFTYYAQLLGLIEQHSPIHEEGGGTNPAMFFLFKDISDILLPGNFAIFLSMYFLFVIFILLLLIIYIRTGKRQFLDIFSMGILAFLLILPRLKPYSLSLALIPIYFLLKDLDIRAKFFSIIIVSVFPLIIKFLRMSESEFVIIKGIASYNQSICLFLIYIYILLVTLYPKMKNLIDNRKQSVRS